MKLYQAKLNNWYEISELGLDNKELESRFMAHGLIPGQKVMVKRRAPIFKDPILIQVGLSQLALTKSEASQIQISTLD